MVQHIYQGENFPLGNVYFKLFVCGSSPSFEGTKLRYFELSLHLNHVAAHLTTPHTPPPDPFCSKQPFFVKIL